MLRPPRPLLSLIELTLRSVLPLLDQEDPRGRMWVVEPGRVREWRSWDEEEPGPQES